MRPSWAFARPVNAEEVTDYYEAIKNPMDLETMENKLNANRYFIPAPEDGHVLTPREGLGLFLKDCQLIFDNCRKYNSDSSNYSKNAEKLRAFLRERLKAYTEDE
ncbi:histone acetyltransferase [Cystobasidiomycetes sp. EMM_F5]